MSGHILSILEPLHGRCISSIQYALRNMEVSRWGLVTVQGIGLLLSVRCTIFYKHGFNKHVHSIGSCVNQISVAR